MIPKAGRWEALFPVEISSKKKENEIKLSSLAVKQTNQVRRKLNRLMIFKINLKLIE